MNKKIYLLLTFVFVSLLSLTSCKESEGLDEYTEWQARNEAYLDFVAKEAKANLGQEVGQWKIIKSYVLDSDQGLNVNDYIYARINKIGTGEVPLYADSVSVYFRGCLINGTLFDNSPAFVPKNALSTDTIFADKPNDSFGDIFKHVVYYPDLEVLIPAKIKLASPGLILGWLTALQEMKEGDYWTIYVPSALGYGNSAQVAFPGGSLLIFDLYLGKRYLR